MRRIAIASLLTLLLAAPAQAQLDDERFVVVATAGEAALSVHDSGDRMCTRLAVGDRGGSTCGEIPAGRTGGELLAIGVDERSYAGGVVPPDTAAVELEFAEGAKVRADVVTGEAYDGRHAGKLRFFAVETSAVTARDRSAEPVLMRRFNAAGELVGAAGGRGSDDATVGRPLTLLDRRRGKVRMRVQAAVVRSFRPTPVQLDRTGRGICISIIVNQSTGATCHDERPYLPPVEVEVSVQCGRAGAVVAGLAGPRTAEVVLLLGSGRRLRVPALDLSDRLGFPARAVARLLPLHEAVRSARAVDAAGTTLDTQRIGAPPGGSPCVRDEGGVSSVGFAGSFSRRARFTERPTEGAQVVAGAEPGPTLLVRDLGDYVCIGIGRLSAEHEDCFLPPLEIEYPAVFSRATEAWTAAAGLVPAAADSASIELEDGRRLPAQILDGPAYTGRYAGKLRFLFAEVPGRHRVIGVETRDAAGKLVSRTPGPDEPRPPVTTLARGRGYRLYAIRHDFSFKLAGMPTQRNRGTCVGVEIDGIAAGADSCSALDARDELLHGWVSCSPRGALLFGPASRGIRGAQLRLADGRTLSSRSVRIPRPLGGGRVWFIRVGASARPRHLRFLGRRPAPRFGPRGRSAGSYALPPATRQCGYGLPDPTF